MPRPRHCRRVGLNPNVTYFKPAGIMKKELDEIILGVDEFEAIRLKDFLNLEQGEAAKKMDISQPTFHRLILEARKKIADAIVNGKAIKIEGGIYKMVQLGGTGRGAGSGKGRGFGGRMGGPSAAGPGGICKCPKCEYEEPQIRGQPCMNKKCPKCGTQMIRGE